MFEVIEGGTEPKIKTKYSSSADLCARKDITIPVGGTVAIPLGVKIDLNYFKVFRWSPEKLSTFLKTHFFELKIRSSLSFEMIIPNGVGEIDIDYPKEICLIVHNPIKTPFVLESFSLNKKVAIDGFSDDAFRQIAKMSLDGSIFIKAGQRVAQIKLMEHKNFLMPDSYTSEEKRTGGLGSTNNKGEN